MFLKWSISQIEHFSNGAILKSNISQMEQFSNGAFWGRHPMPYFKIPRTEKYGMRCATKLHHQLLDNLGQPWDNFEFDTAWDMRQIKDNFDTTLG